MPKKEYLDLEPTPQTYESTFSQLQDVLRHLEAHSMPPGEHPYPTYAQHQALIAVENQIPPDGRIAIINTRSGGFPLVIAETLSSALRLPREIIATDSLDTHHTLTSWVFGVLDTDAWRAFASENKLTKHHQDILEAMRERARNLQSTTQVLHGDPSTLLQDNQSFQAGQLGAIFVPQGPHWIAAPDFEKFGRLGKFFSLSQEKLTQGGLLIADFSSSQLQPSPEFYQALSGSLEGEQAAAPITDNPLYLEHLKRIKNELGERGINVSELDSDKIHAHHRVFTVESYLNMAAQHGFSPVQPSGQVIVINANRDQKVVQNNSPFQPTRAIFWQYSPEIIERVFTTGVFTAIPELAQVEDAVGRIIVDDSYQLATQDSSWGTIQMGETMTFIALQA